MEGRLQRVEVADDRVELDEPEEGGGGGCEDSGVKTAVWTGERVTAMRIGVNTRCGVCGRVELDELAQVDQPVLQGRT